jgi:tRNA uridine 5-carbamoylmethylation protein Kti12
MKQRNSPFVVTTGLPGSGKSSLAWELPKIRPDRGLIGEDTTAAVDFEELTRKVRA